MKKAKIFAAYLPQYHETPENNEFWGKGYTDWVAVRNSKPLFDGHVQPRVPYGHFYYDLSKIDDIKWQCKTARDYGIYGFNIYHYWFKDGRQALQGPAEIIQNNSDINISYFFTWDTYSWVRSWSGVKGNSWTTEYENNGQEKPTTKKVLIEFEYGKESDWEKHYRYLERFFLDDRYYKIDGKPIFIFFGTYNSQIEEMSRYWKKLAQRSGFPGLYIVTQAGSLTKNKVIDAEFIYEPSFSVWSRADGIRNKVKKIFPLKEKKELKIYSYKKSWHKVLRDNRRMIRRELIPGSFVSYDDSPRRGKNARIIKGNNSEEEVVIFEKYFGYLYKMCCQNDKEIMLITAWNEWGEGAYLEPDEKNQYGFLKAIQKVVDNI